jgi:PKHD-type hydroxylase
MNGEWSYFKEHFSSEVCDKIIKKSLEIKEAPATLGAQSNRTSEEWRRSSLRWIQRSNEWNWLYSEIDKLVAQANNYWFNVDYKFLPEIQFASYDAENQGCYKQHKDTHFITPFKTHRKLSFTVQLSDPGSYEGGDLEFVDVSHKPNAENLRSRGTVCIFPSLVYHEVKPVTSGIRHSLAGWYEGPRWR